jgi:glycosyltransferase involved in cell wall biosynthesis
MKLTVLIICFNEKATILKTIEEAKTLQIDKEIIIIDNCSTDGTKEILNNLKYDSALRIIFHNRNMGAGYSACEGVYSAQGDYIYAPGADLEYKMEDVYKMIAKIESENLDVVFGSRLLDRKDVSKFALVKERPYWLGTIIGTFLINLLYGENYTDIIGTDLIKTSILKKINYKNSGQALAFEIVSKLCKLRCKIGEVAIWYKPRTHKEGKTLRAFDMLPAIWAILRVKFFG